MKLPPLVTRRPPLSREELSRYSRHILLPEIGLQGQQRLKGSRVLVVGAGGLGSPVLLYLAAAGVGTLGIVDFDRVDISNLQRQVIHRMSTVGRLKTDSARDAILDLNPHVDVRAHDERLDNDNAVPLFRQYDIVVDGTDNFATRYLVNDACVLADRPYVWGSIYRFEGQASVFWEAAPGGIGVNYRDLYPEPPPPELAPSCSEGGVLGVLCASIASIMATETVKLITGAGDSLLGRLAVYDALEMRCRFLPLRRAPGRQPITALADYRHFCNPAVRQPPNGETIAPGVDVAELKRLLDAGAPLELIDVREPNEWDLVRIPGARLVPKQQMLAGGMTTLDKSRRTVIYCKGGARSQEVVQAMRRAGFTDVSNLDGGVLAWVRLIDPSLPSY
ncbi:molybdopterin biosynthesis-like protein MoeZ [Burkholderia sp. MSMB617WGS]|uniref:Molybdopterin biosynthesis-like protein MoeZ n=1 Tax=Burkholderia savannae TaxID=1637837 RepID=A0ABR5TGQ6_9BURK|nr:MULTISPECIES: molybdopterin-synthase adenylyltransferase MoeB [Burkholderia]AOK48136.1 molybdopterin biosynthesis-like protein MoeZ [Burkholderia sp. MSMB617WGS]KWZ44180.1 molybdopterin biosynthesis-like protein MoeZ [Burkholderia savannae]